jgi:hypothetical protein
MLAVLCVCFLAQAQDSGVSEGPIQNINKPEQVQKITITDDPRQAANAGKIEWDLAGSKVISRVYGSSLESTAYIEGKLKRANAKDWRILWQDREFEVRPSGAFSLEIPYNTDLGALELMAVGASGEVEYFFYKLSASIPVPKPVEKSSDKSSEKSPGRSGLKKKNKRFYISPGLGVTMISYTQTGFDPYSATVLTAKVSANYLLFPPNWDLGGTAFATALTLSHSGPVPVRFIGVNLRMGYVFPKIQEPWRIALYGGWYYSTMLASDETFGYLNVSGPQLFPTMRRTLGNGHVITGYLKFSPISQALSLMSFSNNEVALGLGYVIPTAKHNYSINVDYARLTYSDGSTTLTSSNITLGGSMSF